MAAAAMARGRFVWFCGQDDLISKEAIERALSHIAGNPGLGLIYLNYSQHNDDMSQVLCTSVMHLQARNPVGLPSSGDLTFPLGAGYFEAFNEPPTFLPATIIKREYCEQTDYTKFFGTHYAQAATFLLNLKRGDVVAVVDPLIRGRIPDDGWQTNGTQYLAIMTGNMAMLTRVYEDTRNPIPSRTFETHWRRFMRRLPYLILYSREHGLRLTPLHFELLKTAVRYKLLYYTFVAPLLAAPLPLLQATSKTWGNFRRLAIHSAPSN